MSYSIFLSLRQHIDITGFTFRSNIGKVAYNQPFEDEAVQMHETKCDFHYSMQRHHWLTGWNPIVSEFPDSRIASTPPLQGFK
jgi:hypothetical protein